MASTPAAGTPDTTTTAPAADSSTVTSTATVGDAFAVYLPIEKVSQRDDGTLLVDVIYSSESVDDQGDIVDYDGLKKAAGDYAQWGSVNEMHQLSAVGVALTVTPDDATRTITGQLLVVDPVAVKKVQTGVYKGVSIEGRGKAWRVEKVGARNVRRVTESIWTRTSLVDRPSNPDAFMTIAKRADADAIEKAGDTVTDEPVTDTAAADAPEPETVVETTIGQDIYIGPDGQPIARAGGLTDEQLAAAQASLLPTAEPTETIAKSAANDASWMASAIDTINRLIENEAGETEQVANLTRARDYMTRAFTAENAEVGTPADQEAIAAEQAAIEAAQPVIMLDLAYTTVIGDLAKRAAAIAKGAAPASAPSTDQLHDLAVAAGAACDASPSGVDIAKVAGQVSDSLLTEESIAKFATAIAERVTPPTDIREIVRSALVAEMQPLREQVQKIADQPMPGGAARFIVAPDPRGPAGAGPAASASDAIAKVAAGITDIAVREQLQLAAAAAAITEQRQSS